jgi:hypothetical protein
MLCCFAVAIPTLAIPAATSDAANNVSIFTLRDNICIFKKPQSVTRMEVLPLATLKLGKSHSLGFVVGVCGIEVARQLEVRDATAMSETNSTRTK